MRFRAKYPLYYVGLWLTNRVVGHSEAALRLPSLVCIGLGTFLLFRIARRLADTETARLAIVAFAVWPQVVFAASDARPYALATVLAIAATWALIQWLDHGGWMRASFAVVLAASIPYAHPLAAPILIPFGAVCGRSHHGRLHGSLGPCSSDRRRGGHRAPRPCRDRGALPDPAAG